MQDVQQLWQQTHSGNHEAFAALYRHEVDALYRYGSRICTDTSLLEDAIQELFIEIWKNAANLNPNAPVRQYLLLALRRKLIRHLQQTDTRKQREENAGMDITATEPAPDTFLLEIENQTEVQQQIQNALAQLSERQREVLYLKYFEEQDYETIGQIMGIHYQSVRNLVSNALKALKKLV